MSGNRLTLVSALLLSWLAGSANAERLAHTTFDEPLPGVADYVSTGGELGFTTTFREVLGPGTLHTLGVDGVTPHVFRIRSVESETTFDPVGLVGDGRYTVGLSLTVRLIGASAEWQAEDFFRAELDDGAGNRITLVALGRAELADAPLDTPVRFELELPEGWAEATLVVAGHAASAAHSEILDFDEIEFTRLLTLRGARWRYLDDGSNAGTAWREHSFADGSWLEGPAQLGYGDADEATIIDGGPAGDRFPTSYFRQHFQTAGPGSAARLCGSVLRDDGAVVYLNGAEVFRSNMPAGAIDWQTPALAAVEEREENAFISFPVDPALLVDGDNVLAVELHQDGPATTDASFDLSLEPFSPAAEAKLVRRPYLQQGTSTSVVVRWRTDRPTPSRVRYGPAPYALIRSVEEPGCTIDHEVELTGLAPSSRFYYSVGVPGQVLAGGDADHWFETAPSPGTPGPVRIWITGDSGACSYSSIGCTYANLVLNAYRDFAAPRPADVWLLLGDNAYPHGTDEQFTRGLFQVFSSAMRNSVAFPVPGNHEFQHGISGTSSDLQVGPYYEAFTLPRLGEAGGIASDTEAYYSFDRANVHFVALDSFDTSRSAPPDPVADVCAPGQGGAMYEWLCADLAANTADFTIVYWHDAPYGGGVGNHDTDDCVLEQRSCEMRARFLPVLEGFGVDLQLSGHSHAYGRSKLIDGHYGDGSTFDPLLHVVQPGNGDPDGDGEYVKHRLGPNTGTVYSIVGSSSAPSGTPVEHPAMEVGLADLGSMVIDVSGLQLDAHFIDYRGAVRDHFRIVKRPSVDLAANGDSGAIVTSAGPVQLSLGMTSVGSSEPLDWYWAIVIDDTVHWLTSSGVAASPAPLLSGPPVDLVDVVLMNQAFPSGTVLYSAFILVDDDSVVALDSIAIFFP